jgi:hypothetical protein
MTLTRSTRNRTARPRRLVVRKGNTTHRPRWDRLEDRTLLSFANPVPYTTGGTPSAVAVGDFNGDHTPDIASADFSNGSISVFLGQGGGKFQTTPLVDTGVTTNPMSMAAADFNGDGKADLVVVNGSTNSNSVTVLLSNGDGTFQPTPYTVGGTPKAVAVGDLTGNGLQDIAVACAGTFDSTMGKYMNPGVSVLINQGHGMFGPATFLPAGPSPSSVAIADFDGVHGNDLAVGNSGSGVVDVLMNNGGGSFQPAVPYTHGSDASFVAAGNFINGDTKPDLVSASALANGPVSVWHNNGDGTFQTPPSDYSAGTGSLTQSLAVADLDGNGTDDIVTESQVSGGYVLLSRGDGTFGPPAPTYAGSRVVLADLNGDSAPDAVLLNNTNNTQTSGFGVLINQPGALHLTGNFNSGGTAGVPIELDITPRDWNGAAVTGYSGTVHFTSSDPQATLPPDAPFAATSNFGFEAFHVTLRTAGTQTVSFVDTSSPQSQGSTPVPVNPSSPTKLVLSGLPATARAGDVLPATVTPLDTYGNIATGYYVTVTLASSDPQASLPAPMTFLVGTAGTTLPVVLKTAGSWTVTASGPDLGITPPATVAIAPRTLAALNGFAGMSDFNAPLSAENPDTNAAVGPAYIVETVNWSIAFYNKATGAQVFSAKLVSFFNQLDLSKTFPYDPSVIYDDIAGRFVVIVGAAADADQKDYIAMAVSNDANPLDGFSQHLVDVTGKQQYYNGPLPPPSSWVQLPTWGDFPHIGFNYDAYVLTMNMNTFPTSSAANDVAQVVAIPRVPAINNVPSAFVNPPRGYLGPVAYTPPGTPPGGYQYDEIIDLSLAPAEMHGSQPGDPMWLVDAPLRVTKVTNLLGSSLVFSPPTDLAVAPFTVMGPPLAKDPGGATLITDVTQMYKADWRNNRLVTGDDIGLSNDSDAHAQWYEISTAGSAPTLTQEGTISPGPGIDTYYPSLAIDAAGDIGMDYMESSSTEDVSMYVTGQRFGDPAGTMSAPLLAKAGEAPYGLSGAEYRSGDFSAIETDPVTGASFWAANEYAVTPPSGLFGSNWGDWIENFSLRSPSRFRVDAPASSPTGAPVTFAVTATDAYNNTISDYTGTVQVTTSDPAAALLSADFPIGPGTYQFQSTDNGSHSFPNGVRLKSEGNRTLTVSDTATPLIQGVAAIAVTPRAVGLRISAPQSVEAGKAFSITITAVLDASGTVDTGYTGTVHFTSTDGQAALPADFTFQGSNGGVATFSNVFLKTSQAQSITATDTFAPAVLGSAVVTVTAATATQLAFTPIPASAIAGVPFNVTVTALDQYGNPDPTFHDQVTITSLDAAATLPPSHTYDPTTDQGTYTFQVTLRSPGNQTIKAADPSLGFWYASPVVNPGFYDATHVAAGTTLSSVAVGDFNGDGIPDLVVADSGTYDNTGHVTGGGVSILLGKGGGAFQPAQMVLPGGSPTAVVTGRFHGYSGNTDIVVYDRSTSSLILLAGLGNGTFAPPAPIPSNVIASNLFTGDFNGDGKPDLLTAAGDTVTVWLGNGFGTFQPMKPYPIGISPNTMTAADMNNDGKTDLVTAVGNTVSVLPSNGDGTFQAATNYATVGFYPTTLAAADFNRDGLPDLALTNGQGGTVDVLLNQGGGSFGPLTAYAAGSSSSALLAADVNGDGAPDLVEVDSSSDQVSLLVNHFATSLQVQMPSPSQQVLSGGPFSITVTARDALRNIAPSYTGTVHFTSSDAHAVLPADYTFTPLDAGSHTFTITIPHPGYQSVTATDAAVPGISGTGFVLVTARPPDTFLVTTTADSGPGSLRQAILDANADLGGDIIQFAPGVSGTITLTSGELDITDTVDIQGPGAGVLTVSGNNASRVFGLNDVATISGLTITGGSSSTGGGLFNEAGALTVNSCIFTGNVGSGIFNEGGALMVNNSTFISNTGALFTDWSVISGTPTSYTAYGAGGIYNSQSGLQGGIVTVSGSTFTANLGGGIFNYRATANGTYRPLAMGETVPAVTVSDSTFSGNQGLGGAGIFNLGGGTLTVSTCTFSGNFANAQVGVTTGQASGGTGGGINDIFGSTLTVSNSTFSDNRAGMPGGSGYGGALSVTYGGVATVSNCTFASNSANFAGGAIFQFLATLSVINSTISGNSIAGNSSTNLGGGIYAGGLGLSVGNTIIGGNTANTGPDVAATVTSLGYNLIGNTSGSHGFGAAGDQLNVNPHLGPLAANGGPTQTMGLLPGSPAIGAGSSTLSGVAVPTTDQRGFARVVSGTVDIGAFEAQQEPTTTTVTASPATSVSGQLVAFTATVTPPQAGPIYTLTGSIQFEVDGSDFGSPVPLVNNSATSAGIGSLSIANHTVSAVYTSDIADFVASAGSTPITVEDATVSNIQSVVNNAPSSSGSSVTLQTPSSTAVSTALQAINAATPASPVTVTLDLGGATTTPTTTISASTGVQIDFTSSSGSASVQGATVTSGTVVIAASVAPVNWTINGGNVIVQGSASAGDFIVNGGTVTLANGTVITGNSPAIILNSGTVVLKGVTARTATNSPTIVVNGGSLVVRGSTIQGSTGSAQAAIQINGGSVDLGTSTSPGGNTFNVNGTGTLIQNTTSSSVPTVGDTFENNGAAVASNFGVVSLAAPPAQTANQGVPQPFSLGSLTDTVKDSQSWAVDINWGDSSPHTGLNATSTGPLSAQSHAFALPGTYTVTVTATDSVASGVTVWDLVQTFTVTVEPSIFVLNPTASGALTLSSTASLKIPGAVVVDSSSKAALSASGSAQVTASAIDVVGGVQKSGGATFSPAPTTGVAPLPDPLAGLSGPSTAGLTDYGSVNLSSGSLTINPGIYSKINVSGTGTSLTLNPGTYIIEGGGLTVSGSASLTGSGVFLYNAGSNYPNAGGSYGGITLSGSGTIALTAPTSGPYAGIVIFQSRDNTRALSFSGSAMGGMSGTIYAADAALSVSGSASLQDPLDVGTLNLSGSVTVTQVSTAQDRNVPDPSAGAAPPTAAGFCPPTPSIALLAPRGSGAAATAGSGGLAPLDNPAPGGPGSFGRTPSGPAPTRRIPQSRRPAAVASHFGPDLRVSGRPRIPILDSRSVDSVLGEIGSPRDLLG